MAGGVVSPRSLQINNNNNNNKPRSSTSNPSSGKTKDLKQIIKELEESDYGGYGSWGNFKIRREYRDKKYGRSSYDVADMDDSPSDHNNDHHPQQQQLVLSATRQMNIFDYYKPHNSQELVQLLEKHQLLKSPKQKFNLNKIPSMGSFMKISILTGIIATLSYISVAPHNLPLAEYNAAYKSNLCRVGYSLIAPILLFSQLFRHRDADINTVISIVFSTITMYYPLICFIEKSVATLMRLAILKIFDSAAFKLSPEIPVIFLPWVLKQNKYLPRRITTFLFLFTNFCITAPIIEELSKSYLLKRILLLHTQRGSIDISSNNSSNTLNTTLPSSSFNTSSSYPLQITQRNHHQLSVRSFVLYMLSITLGLKVADNTRRILLYSSPKQMHKGFFAAARGVYPVQELCGIFVALDYAKQFTQTINGTAANSSIAMQLDNRFPWRSIALHAMATMRGMKPFFVWDSHRPWDEVQLQAWNAVDERTPMQLITAGLLNLAWFTALYKYLQVAIKKYFKLSGQYYQHLQEEAFAFMTSQRNEESQQHHPQQYQHPPLQHSPLHNFHHQQQLFYHHSHSHPPPPPPPDL